MNTHHNRHAQGVGCGRGTRGSLGVLRVGQRVGSGGVSGMCICVSKVCGCYEEDTEGLCVSLGNHCCIIGGENHSGRKGGGGIEGS